MSLIAALFIIVVLAMLGLFAVRTGASGEEDVTATMLGDRALAAARSGVENGAFRAMAGGCTSSAGPAYPTLALAGALTGFSVVVRCTGWSHINLNTPGVPYWTYEVTATASRGVYGTSDYVARTVTKIITTGPPT